MFSKSTTLKPSTHALPPSTTQTKKDDVKPLVNKDTASSSFQMNIGGLNLDGKKETSATETKSKAESQPQPEIKKAEQKDQKIEPPIASQPSTTKEPSGSITGKSIFALGE